MRKNPFTTQASMLLSKKTMQINSPAATPAIQKDVRNSFMTNTLGSVQKER